MIAAGFCPYWPAVVLWASALAVCKPIDENTLGLGDTEKMHHDITWKDSHKLPCTVQYVPYVVMIQ